MLGIPKCVPLLLEHVKRLQLFEFEDLSWVPRVVRDGGTDLLDLGFARMGFYDGVVSKLEQLLGETRVDRMVDLCSGGGGGTLQVVRHLRRVGNSVPIVLSDRHPNEAGIARVQALADASTTYRTEPVDAMTGGGALSGMRTMAGALHHFTPESISQLLQGIVKRGEPVFFMDVAASSTIRKMPPALLPLAVLLNMLPLVVGSLFLTPFVHPFRLSRWLLTYVLPAIPILVAWDGTVSALRAYSPDELLDLARGVPGGDQYAWESARAGKALYLSGKPLPTSATR